MGELIGTPQESAVWIFTPLYFDVESFLTLHDKLLSLQASCQHNYKLCFVVIDDSASEDPELSKLKRVENLTIVTPPLNLGHQRAIVFGLRVMRTKMSDSDIIITMDGDGEDRPEDITRLIEQLRSSEPRSKKIVLAQRTVRKTSRNFKIMYFFFQILFRGLTGVVIKTGNFACYHAEVLKRIIDHPAFDRCYSSTLIALRVKKIFVPCARGLRYAGESRMQTIDLAIHGFRMLMPFIDRIAVRLLLTVGLLISLTVLIFAELLFARFYLLLTIPAWELQIVFGLLLVSILLFANFIILFTVFSQSQSISLQGIEQQYPGRSAG